jgi:hypothetical protein
MSNDPNQREITRLDLALAEAREEIESLRAQLEQCHNERAQLRRQATATNLDIQKLLVLSVNHLSDSTRGTLDAGLAPVGWAPQIDHDFGWDWYVASESADLSDYPPEFDAIFQLARQHNCQWVRFDLDGPELDVIPVWDGTTEWTQRKTKGGH